MSPIMVMVMMIVTTPPAVVVVMVVMPVPAMMMMMPLCKLHRPLFLRLARGCKLICGGELVQRIGDRPD